MNVVAKFEVPYTQFLDKNGQLTQELPKSLSDPEQALKLYQLMTLLRTFDSKAVTLQRTGKMGTYAGTLGQEAVGVAVGHVMAQDDILASTYREYGALFQRGVRMEDILMYWGGDERGSAFNHPDDFPICVPLSTQCLHATGAAKAIQLRRQKRAVVCVIGDGATSEGNFYEALNVAGAWKLPVVFVVNNNKWAISVPLAIQTGAETIAQKAFAGGFKGEQVDGNDVFAIANKVDEALQKARAGEGPHLIECLTYRLCDHTTADDASRYRPEGELEQAWQEEPIARLKKYLENNKLWDETKEQAHLKDCQDKVEAAVNHYFNSDKQAPESMFDYLYEQLPEAYLEQREALLANNYGRE